MNKNWKTLPERSRQMDDSKESNRIYVYELILFNSKCSQMFASTLDNLQAYLQHRNSLVRLKLSDQKHQLFRSNSFCSPRTKENICSQSVYLNNKQNKQKVKLGRFKMTFIFSPLQKRSQFNLKSSLCIQTEEQKKKMQIDFQLKVKEDIMALGKLLCDSTDRII
ncbi:Hypothetical_protein [Hexamita inflata]|uniref:Hypothetical_protein n=1 Tax=Hexamita inflata TaxID=28002 RepID=A0AA86UT94_9EUKA|nr:Hypothetical protein HINF_LOCUS54749 [Hexamita inflata]